MEKVTDFNSLLFVLDKTPNDVVDTPTSPADKFVVAFGLDFVKV